jgi:hypothetical protein
VDEPVVLELEEGPTASLNMHKGPGEKAEEGVVFDSRLSNLDAASSKLTKLPSLQARDEHSECCANHARRTVTYSQEVLIHRD